MRIVLTLLWACSCVLVGGACVDDASLYSGDWVEPEAPLRLKPKKFETISLEIRNDGTSTWTSEHVYVEAREVPDSWKAGVLNLTRTTQPGEVGTFRGDIYTGTQVGLFEVSWAALVRGVEFGGRLTTVMEVTCLDALFCNGEERFADGQCVAGANPCADGAKCTEEGGCQ